MPDVVGSSSASVFILLLSWPGDSPAKETAPVTCYCFDLADLVTGCLWRVSPIFTNGTGMGIALSGRSRVAACCREQVSMRLPRGILSPVIRQQGDMPGAVTDISRDAGYFATGPDSATP